MGNLYFHDMHDDTGFKSFDGKTLHVEKWTTPNSKAVLCLCHGMAEYAARYDGFAHFLNEHEIDVWSYDQRGHGNHMEEGDTVGFIAKENGWNVLVKDLEAFIDHVARKYMSTPIALMGHSMGSLVALNCFQKKGPKIKGLILSSFPENPGLLRSVGAGVAAVQKAFAGGKSLAKLHTALSFGEYNKAYKPNRTAFDWISRDEAEVDKYVNDPMCGGTFTASFFSDLLEGVKSAHHPSLMTAMDRDIPVYMFCGSEDPVVGKEKGFDKSVAEVRAVSHHVHTKVYPGARHEMLNEINRDEVYQDVLRWLNEKVC